MKWITLGALILVLSVVIQIMRPKSTAPSRDALLTGAHVPEAVVHILTNACQDCHSNNTNLPWYANSPPVSWLVKADVARGRSFFNLSEWEKYGKGRRLGILASMANATEKRRMPPRYYTILHADARLSDADRKRIAEWANQEYRRIRAGTR